MSVPPFEMRPNIVVEAPSHDLDLFEDAEVSDPKCISFYSCRSVSDKLDNA